MGLELIIHHGHVPCLQASDSRETVLTQPCTSKEEDGGQVTMLCVQQHIEKTKFKS